MGLICRMGLLLLHSSCKALHVRRLKGEAARQRLETATAPRCRLNEVNVRKHVQWPSEHKLLITPTANLISWWRISGISHKAELLLMEFICSRTGTRTTCRTAPDHEARLEGLVLRPDHLKVLLWLENKNDTFLFFSTLSMIFCSSTFCTMLSDYPALLPTLGPHLHWHNDWNVPVTVWSWLQPQPAYFPLDMVKPLSSHDDDDNDDDAHRCLLHAKHLQFWEWPRPNALIFPPSVRFWRSSAWFPERTLTNSFFRRRRWRRVRPLKHHVFLKGK